MLQFDGKNREVKRNRRPWVLPVIQDLEGRSANVGTVMDNIAMMRTVVFNSIQKLIQAQPKELIQVPSSKKKIGFGRE